MNGIEIQYRKRIETAFLLDALTSILSTVTPLMKLEKRKVIKLPNYVKKYSKLVGNINDGYST